MVVYLVLDSYEPMVYGCFASEEEAYRMSEDEMECPTFVQAVDVL